MKKQLKGLGNNVLQPFIHTIHDTIDQLSQEHIVVSQPTTQGFIDRICPNVQCKATFKVNMNTWTGGNMLSCVKCGNQYSRDMFITAQQQEYAISVALNTINEKYNFGWISSSETYIPPDTDTEITCEACQCCYIVRGKFGYCPQCGRHNCLQWAITELNEILQNDTMTMKEIQKAYISVTNVLKIFGNIFIKIINIRNKTNDKLNLQVAEPSRNKLHDLGIDISEDIYIQWKLGVNLRHLVEYQAGEIEELFIERTAFSKHMSGRLYLFNINELQDFIHATQTIVTTMYMQLYVSAGHSTQE